MAKEKENRISDFKNNNKKLHKQKKLRGRIPSLHWILQLGRSIYKKMAGDFLENGLVHWADTNIQIL